MSAKGGLVGLSPAGQRELFQLYHNKKKCEANFSCYEIFFIFAKLYLRLLFLSGEFIQKRREGIL